MRGRLKSALLALALSALSASPVFAEQPAADEYRMMFMSGNFYVEYQDKFGRHVLAGINGRRMGRMAYGGDGLRWLNPLGALFGDETPKYPQVMYQNGKYYQFKDDDKAVMLAEDQLANENLNPAEGWSGIRQNLALPDELAVFYWYDPCRRQSPSVSEPRFTESLKRVIRNTTYDCDKYVSTVLNADGGSAGEIVYIVMYDKGKLSEIEKSFVKNGKTSGVNSLKIKKLEGAIPEGAFKIKKNTKVYAAGTGDMNDLIDQPVQVEVLDAESIGGGT